MACSVLVKSSFANLGSLNILYGELGYTVGMLFSIEGVSLGLCCVLGIWDFFYCYFLYTHCSWF